MLAHLTIRDIVLIDRLDVDLSGGLTVLTGETGAGKSILLDAFALALGGRGDGSLVREGAAQGQVSAAFDLAANHPARAAAAAAEIDSEGDLILRRVQMADGRTRAFVNDQPVSVQVLRTIGAALVEIHGQHDDRALTDPTTHRALLDASAGLDGERQQVAILYEGWRSAGRALAVLTAEIEKARADADYLRHASDELTKLGPEPGEEQMLAERRIAMQQAEKVAGELREAYDILGGERSAGPAISSVMRRLERRAAQAPHLIEPTVKALDAALLALDEAQGALQSALDEANFDPHDLETCEERLFALRAAARKYSVPVDDLSKLAHSFGEQLASLDAGEHRLVALERAVDDARVAYDVAAAALSAGRRAAAGQLEAAVNQPSWRP